MNAHSSANKKLKKNFSTTNTQQKLPYLYMSEAGEINNNNKPHPQHHQIVQNERKITNNLAYNHNGDNYQRQKRETNNLLGDNELFGIYESSQNDGI